jgi:dihydrolipoamide dehydrogenase
VALDDRGRPLALDPWTLQLGEAAVFLAGDANDLHPLLHEAADDGHVAGANAARLALANAAAAGRASAGEGGAPAVQAGDRRVPMGVVFSDPNIGFVGVRASALDRGRVCVAEVSFANQGRARVMRQNHGLLRLWAERGSGVLLGAEFVGPRMEHLAHLLAWTVQQRLTVHQALAMPFYHPVIEEGLRTGLQNLARALRQGRPLGEPCEAVVPGA